MSNRWRGWLLPVLAVLSPAPLLQAYFGGNWYAFFDTYSLGMFFGLSAFVWFGLTLMLSARIRLLDAIFGHDRVLIFHGYLALCAVLFVVVHAALKYIYFGLGTLQITLGIVALGLFLGVTALTIQFMIVGVVHRLRLIARLRTFGVSRLGLSYSRLKVVHNLMSVASLFMVVHVMLASATGETNLRMGLIGGWGTLCILVYIYHKAVRPLVNYVQGHTVTAVKRLTEGIVEVQLSAKPRRPYRAGQFVYLRLLSRACGSEEHPFTLSSSPAVLPTTVTIKSLGDYTSRLPAVEPGTRAVIDGPYGRFTPQQTGAGLLFVAGGIGITPFLAILREWDRAGIRIPVALVWSVRYEIECIDEGFFDQLAKRHTQFSFRRVVTRPRNQNVHPSRISRDMLASLTGAPDNAHTLQAYLCGPDPLRRSVVRWLRELGVPGAAIHFERFSS